MKTINIRPLVIILVFAVAGVLSAHFSAIYGSAVLYVSIATGVSAFVAYFLVHFKDKRKAVYCLALFCLCAVAFVTFGSYYKSTVKKYSSAVEYTTEVAVSGTVYSVIPYETYDVYVLDCVTVNGKGVDGRLRLTVKDGEEKYSAGDRLSFDGMPVKYEKYSYGRLSAEKIVGNVKYRLTVDGGDVTFAKARKRNVFVRVRQAFYDVLKKNTSDEVFPVAYAMLIGDDAYMDEATASAFRYSGIAHIFAVSGLHIGIVSAFLGFLFEKSRLGKYFSAPIIIAVLVFYAGVCGFTPSSVRAVIMCSVGLVFDAFGLKRDFLNNVSLSALIILAINPVYLFTISFLLSFACVYAIAVICAPLRYALKRKLHVKRKLAGAIAVSVSAFIGTFPAMMYFFKGSSVISVLTNLLFLPVMSFSYVLTFAGTVLSVITGLGNVFLYLPNLLLLGSVRFLRALDFSGFMFYAVSFDVFFLLFYAIFALYSGLVNISGKAVKRVTGVLTICFVICVSCLNISNYVSLSVTVRTDFNGGCFAIVNCEEDCIVFATTSFDKSKENTIRDAVTEAGAKNIDCFVYVGCVPSPNERERIKDRLRCNEIYATLSEASFNSMGDKTIGEGKMRLYGFDVYSAGSNGETAVVERNGNSVAICASKGYLTKFYIGRENTDLIVCACDAKLYDRANEADAVVSCVSETGYLFVENNGELRFFIKNGVIRNAYKLQNVD